MNESRIHVVVGLGFGDEGKGSIVDYLVRRDEMVGTVVRFNGGPQAAHRVVASDGRSHVCSQFGAGVLVPGVRTHLAAGMLVSPPNLMRENDALRRIGVNDALARLTVDPDCVLVTPFHVLANRALEAARGDNRHGSCGQGVGEARRDLLEHGVAIRAGDCLTRATLDACLRELQELAREKLRDVEISEVVSGLGRWPIESPGALPAVINAFRDPRWLGRIDRSGNALSLYLSRGNVVFEGAQGVLLDETYGFHPHTTWTNTTAAPALELLDAHDALGGALTVGVLRAYATRHGAGPFPSESVELTARLRDDENGDGAWQGPFRVGWFDVPLARYALSVCPVDEVAVTCLDRAEPFGMEWRGCVGYAGAEPVRALSTCDKLFHGERLTDLLRSSAPLLLPLEPSAEAYAWVLDRMLDVPATLFSYGPTAADKRTHAAAEAAA